MLRWVCRNPSGASGLIHICPVKIFLVLNVSYVSNLGQSAYLETETRIFTSST